MGLLPTPPPANNAVVRSSSDRPVPSLLDLSVDPTQELQEKIDSKYDFLDFNIKRSSF